MFMGASLAGYLASVLGCFMSCATGFLRYFNRHAFVEIAITGDSYFKGAVKAFQLVNANSLRFSVLSTVSDLVLFVFCGALTLVSGYLVDSVFSGFIWQLDQAQQPTGLI